MANELATRSNTNLPGFQSAEGFELLQRQAKMFTHSTLVPQQFQGEQNMGNAIIALEMATRMNASPLMVCLLYTSFLPHAFMGEIFINVDIMSVYIF